MKTRLFSQLVLGILILFISVAVNISLHELGHFVIADSVGLSPEIHLESPVNIDGNTVVATPNFAYVSYNNIFPEATWRDASIAIGGPLVNAMLALSAAGFYIFSSRKNKALNFALLTFMLISVISFAVNMIPIAPSDGSIIFGYLVR